MKSTSKPLMPYQYAAKRLKSFSGGKRKRRARPSTLKRTIGFRMLYKRLLRRFLPVEIEVRII
jgi:hypothetical protein